MQRRQFLRVSMAFSAAATLPACFQFGATDDPQGDTDPPGQTDIPASAIPEFSIGEAHLDWDADGNLYEILSSEHVVRRVDAAGEELWSVGGDSAAGEFNYPSELVHSPEHGVIHVLDQGNSRVAVLDTETGDVLTSISEHGDSEGQTGPVLDAALDDLGQLVLVDPWNHRIQVFDVEGGFVQSYGEFGTEEPHHLNSPMAIAIDHERQVHVVDRGNFRIQVFTDAGAWVRKYGDPETLRDPSAIAIDAEGRCYVADTIASVVEVFDIDGTPLETLDVEVDGFPAHPTHLNWMPDGRLYIRVSEHRQTV